MAGYRGRHAPMRRFVTAPEYRALEQIVAEAIAEGRQPVVLGPAGILHVTGPPRRCRICGCTDADCRQCIKKTGKPCHWIEPDLCSACAVEGQSSINHRER